MLVVVLLGAVQMFVLGMIGEYLGRLYIESKHRPLYIVADVAGPVVGTATLGFRAAAVEDASASAVENGPAISLVTPGSTRGPASSTSE